jgi:hypothetical protein
MVLQQLLSLGPKKLLARENQTKNEISNSPKLQVKPK